MNEHDVRPLAESEFRPSRDLFMRTLGWQALSEQRWQCVSATYEHGRVFGAFWNGELSGTTLSWPSELTVPGGQRVPAAAVSAVGVRPDRTRRRLLTGLMREQLADVRRRGEPVAMLHASETGIYGRFGYGPATRARDVALARRDARIHPAAPSSGEVRLIDNAALPKVLPEIYRRMGARPGMIARSDAWWQAGAGPEGRVAAVHTGADGTDDGFVIYESASGLRPFGDGIYALHVLDLTGADTAAIVDLWRFLLGVDLVTEVAAISRPLDEPMEWWLTDRRACRVTGVTDDLWVRLVDVPAALGARRFGATEPVVLAVRDAFLPENSGTYRISPAGVGPCADAPQLSMDADMLATVYLGDVAVSTLAESNRIEVHDPRALPAADELFTTAQPPWCGTGF